MSQSSQLPLTSRLEPLPALGDLKVLWEQLAPSDGGSFFTSWEWIEAWLLELRAPGQYLLLRICRGSTTVAAGIIAIATVRRPRRLARRVAHLHATGDAESDSTHIEQNGLVTRDAALAEMCEECLRCLLSLGGKWDEIDLRGVEHGQHWTGAAQRFGLLTEVENASAPSIAFDRLAAGRPLWQAAVNRKARYELRRCLNDYERAFGQLQVIEPSTVDEALAFFDELSRLHEQHWLSRNIRSPFASSRVRSFHHRLVTAGHASRRVRVLRIVAGASIVGYVYLLVQHRTANFYQSGFNYGLLKRHSQPGWLCLQMAIEHLRAEGLVSFEFLTGGESYKQRLANAVSIRSWIRLTKPTAAFRAERAALSAGRFLRSSWRRLFTPSGVGLQRQC